jgi:hypothetical protein
VLLLRITTAAVQYLGQEQMLAAIAMHRVAHCVCYLLLQMNSFASL